ncbi:MAG: GNAT family N-acetyltransferase [Mycobacteriales bacterium]|nr:GNAT family N-acetyltransferase [Frankia sp.]
MPDACGAGDLRLATVADAAELARLRAVMIESWGGDASEPQWRTSCVELLERRLADDDDEFVAYVMDDPAGGLCSGGVAWLEQHLPGPNNLTGKRGHIASMSTDGGHRRHGHGRAVFTALLDWLTGHGLSRIDLRATPHGEPLYREFGFREPGGLALSWRLPGTDIMDASVDAASLDRDVEPAPSEAHA